MKKQWISGVVVACGVVLMANGAWADKAAIEKKAKETIIDTISFKQVTIEKVLETIANKGGIVIKKVDIPKDTPPVTFEAKHISALEALKIVTAISGLTCTITDAGIEVSRKKDEAGKKQDGSLDPFKP